ncbi:hypothetical protein M3Y97_00738400 [Aphelenchoides bicaudatus]|nr:hypothetical protein M3Y97_00738400 [Aphelenchoides bicaudatus]
MSRSMSSNTLQAYTSRRSLSSVGASSSKGQPNVFVIEIGTRLTRIGIAGEHAPRQVFRTQFIDPIRPTKMKTLYDPNRDIDEQERILTTFFKELTLGKLIKNSSNSRFFIVDNLFLTSDFRDMCARVLFRTKSLEVHAISFVPGPLMSLITMNASMALLLDTGINECLLYPVFDRFVVYQDFDATPNSTAAVEGRIRELITEHGRVIGVDGKERQLNDDDLKLFDKLNCAEDICYRFCFATTRERSLENQKGAELKRVPSVKVSFGFEILVVPGVVREFAADVVFKHDHDLRSIPQLIVEFIDNASIETKTQYLSNLMFVGGLSNMRGFLKRVHEELCFLLDDYKDGRYSKLKGYIKFYTRPEPASTLFSTAWVGASLISSFDYNQWFTRQEWIEGARVPDWTMDIDAYLQDLTNENVRIYTEQPEMIHC